MIARVRGPVVDCGNDSLIVEAGGVGYEVRVPKSYILRLKDAPEIILYTEQIVRQDTLLLYGFETKAEHLIFNLLLSVSKIGPQLALSILNNLTVNEIVTAVLDQNASVFEHVSGIGKTGAGRIILELKKKVTGQMSTISTNEQKSVLSTKRNDAELVLISLGYMEESASRAISAADKENDYESVSDLVKAALVLLKEESA